MPPTKGSRRRDAIPGSFQGTALFLFGAVGAFLALEALGVALSEARSGGVAGPAPAG